MMYKNYVVKYERSDGYCHSVISSLFAVIITLLVKCAIVIVTNWPYTVM